VGCHDSQASLRPLPINGLLGPLLFGGPLKTLRQVKRMIIAVFGGTVLLIGIALIFLPGPAFVVIPAGLAILGTEFAWARRWLSQMKCLVRKKQVPPPDLAGSSRSEQPSSKVGNQI